MNFFLICVLSVTASLPCALGLLCYDCTPGLQNMCTGNNITVTNCTGMYDACQTSGLQISLKLPKVKMDMRVMSCSMKSACSKITTDGCKNVTSLTKAVPGSKVDACGVSCCYTDKCNTKDLVVLSKPTAKSVAPFSEVSLIINLLVFLLSAGIAVTAI
ncbi:uncharacterized protein [Pocillopora verrucosa]|uniref:uncharacterized protein n=1 Tax=Pocillopora verrucosa TaxID=203993 RepID=UPI0027979FE1|nr:uncharacterized protein LOC131769625 [Pocillopora verrucosa]